MSHLAAAPHAPDPAGRRRSLDGAGNAPGVWRWLFVLVVLLAIGLRLVAWRGAADLAGDGPDALWQAQRVLAGDVNAALSHPVQPLYALAIAAAAWLTEDLVLASKLISILSGVLIVLAVTWLARLALPDRHDVACGAALLAALYPPGLLVTSSVTGEGLFVALFLLAMALLFSGEQSGKLRLRLYGVGLLLGLAWLTRAEGALLLLPIAVWIVAGLVRRESRRHEPLPPRGVYASALVLCLLGMALFVLPAAMIGRAGSGTWGEQVVSVGGVLRGEPIAAPVDSPLGSPCVGEAPSDELLSVTDSWIPPDVAKAFGAGLRRSGELSDGARGAAPASEDAATTDAAGNGEGEPPAPPPRSNRPIQRLFEKVHLFGVAYAESALMLGRTLRIDMLLLAGLGLPVVLRRRVAMFSVLVLLLAGWLTLAALQLVLRGALGPSDLLGPALLVLPVAGAGAAWLWGAERYYPERSGALLWIGRVLVVLLVVALIGLSVADSLNPPPGDVARAEALAWVREHSDPAERVAVMRRGDAWSAQRPILAVALPVDAAEVVAEMQRLDVRLLVQRLDDVQQHAPEWLAGGLFVEQARFGEGDDVVVVLERSAG